ncbi:putative quinol monooxygenase [Synechococcus sp. PCC 7502]|uniref:putative quinol monooxygenase n=1 Tax=Synechococcus sp. PCC 7502 TaxID=1173263 RepID=UPI001FEDFDA3|nr:putative quinol monooxygenase [Synechococcus sp. PCC 7502]
MILICVSFVFWGSPSWADDDNELIVVAGQVKVKPEKEKEFISFSESLISPSRAEAGAISYSFYKDGTQDNVYIFYEEWKNQAALDYHFQTPYFKEFVKKAPDLLAEPPVIKIYHVASLKVLN